MRTDPEVTTCIFRIRPTRVVVEPLTVKRQSCVRSHRATFFEKVDELLPPVGDEELREDACFAILSVRAENERIWGDNVKWHNIRYTTNVV
jgi:hypothetical protein